MLKIKLSNFSNKDKFVNNSRFEQLKNSEILKDFNNYIMFRLYKSEQNNKKLKIKVKELEYDIEGLEKDINELENEVNELEDEVDELEDSFDSIS